MNKRQVLRVFSKSAGIEISATEKTDKNEMPVSGTVTIRFFSLEPGKKDGQLRYIMEPAEANEVACEIKCIINSKQPLKKKMAPHKFSRDSIDVFTSLAIEQYGNPAQFAITINRGKVTINVPMSRDRILYIARFLEKLSLDQAWETVYEKKAA